MSTQGTLNSLAEAGAKIEIFLSSARKKFAFFIFSFSNIDIQGFGGDNFLSILPK
jgi:hypothetical protein